MDVQVVEAIDHVVDFIEVQTVELDVFIEGWLSGEDVDHGPILVSVIFPCAIPEVTHGSPNMSLEVSGLGADSGAVAVPLLSLRNVRMA